MPQDFRDFHQTAIATTDMMGYSVSNVYVTYKMHPIFRRMPSEEVGLFCSCFCLCVKSCIERSITERRSRLQITWPARHVVCSSSRRHWIALSMKHVRQPKNSYLLYVAHWLGQQITLTTTNHERERSSNMWNVYQMNETIVMRKHLPLK